jgi:pimeloyl-ACP methyl ester carboxylesterase
MPPRIVLLHSPLVGPATWRPVAEQLAARGAAVEVPSLLRVEAAPPPYWPWLADTAARALLGREPAVVVAHSGAGLLLPAIAERAPGRALAYILVDASLPVRGREAAGEEAFRAQLERLAEDGVLPPWSQWFGEEAMVRLVPDEALRAEVERELPRLPLAYFDHRPPVPDGWPDAPCAYLQFSEVYTPRAAEARTLGWRVEHLPGGHLHMLVEPAAVAGRLLTLSSRLVRDG